MSVSVQKVSTDKLDSNFQSYHPHFLPHLKRKVLLLLGTLLCAVNGVCACSKSVDVQLIQHRVLLTAKLRSRCSKTRR